jgi:hypothetical protein
LVLAGLLGALAPPEGWGDDWWTAGRNYANSALDSVRALWQQDQPANARLWEGLLPPLEEILVLQERQQNLPESSWLGEDRVSSAREINALLDEAATVLTGDSRLRERLHELDRVMEENRAALTELKRRRLTAPRDSLWRQTVAEIDADIVSREALLAEQRTEMARLRQAFAARLRQIGLDIDDERLDFLLSTIVGDDVVDMTMAFERVRRLTQELEDLMVASREDLATARRYYGMYVVLLRVLERMHARLLARIEGEYLPRIGSIAERARALRAETLGLHARAPSPVLQGNLEAQQLTLRAADRYGDYLRMQRRQVAASRDRLSEDLAVARNTFETVKVSGELVALMQHSKHLFDSLFGLQMPPLRAFENLQMKQEFERLTRSLQGADQI